MTFGEIPPDVVAVAPSVPEEIRAKLVLSLVATANDAEHRAMVKDLFGADGFGPVVLESYAGLRSTLSLESKTENWDDMSKV